MWDKTWGRNAFCPGRAVQKRARHVKELHLTEGGLLLVVTQDKEGGQGKPHGRGHANWRSTRRNAFLGRIKGIKAWGRSLNVRACCKDSRWVLDLELWGELG